MQIDGTVSVEIVGGTRHERNNVQHSELLRWSAYNPLPEGLADKEEGSREFWTWFEQVIIDLVMKDKFSLSASITNTIPLHVAWRIAVRSIQFNDVSFLYHLFKYRIAITTDKKWMVVERSGKIRSRALHAPFAMKLLAQVTIFLLHFINAIGILLENIVEIC